MPFDYAPTPVSVRARYRNGAWSHLETTTDKAIAFGEAAPALLYGHQAFDALTVTRVDAGRALAFRLDDHAARLGRSSKRILLPPPPPAMVREAVMRCVQANARHVPPSEDGRAFFVRVTVWGAGNRLSVREGGEALLWTFGCPVGRIGRDGMSLWISDRDRAAPRGTGAVKVGGNYAAGFLASHEARERGHDDAIYLDPLERRWLTETNTANVVFVPAADQLVLPADPTVLPSITVDSLCWLLRHHCGIGHERRRVAIDDLPGMREAACVGNATGVRRVAQIADGTKTWSFPGGPDGVIAAASRLLDDARKGAIECPGSWHHVINLDRGPGPPGAPASDRDTTP